MKDKKGGNKKSNTGNNKKEIQLKEVKGFKVLPYRIENSNGESIINYIYFKKHSSASLPAAITELSFPVERTVFFYNLPLDFSDKDIRTLIIGAVRKPLGLNKVYIHCPNSIGFNSSNEIIFNKKNTQATKALNQLFDTKDNVPNHQILQFPAFAYVSFKTVEDLELLLNCKLSAGKENEFSKNLVTIKPEKSSESNSGIKRWLNQYDLCHPESDLLQSYVDEYAAEYQHHINVKNYEADKKHDLPDEDGFITVTTRGTHTAGNVTVKGLSAKKAKTIQKRVQIEGFGKPTPIPKFYRHMSKDSKKEQLARLREQFDQDKKLIAQMKQSKMFQPEK